MGLAQILVLVLVALILIGGLVALGMGHRRWSIATVVAGFLVLLASTAYLVLAARVAVRERAWKRAIRNYEVQIAKTRDDLEEDKDGVLKPPAAAQGSPFGGADSLANLRDRRDRWQRALDRVETWRGRTWEKASFQPPRDDNATGLVEFAAEGNDESRPPINDGSRVFLFDAADLADGGMYIGEFRVRSHAFDQATKRHTLTVEQTQPRDTYDERALKVPHDDVIVFEQLPVDRWLAFYTKPADAGTAAWPEPAKDDAQLDAVVGEDPAIKGLLADFVTTFKAHETDVPKDDWEAAALEARERPGTLWADVEFLRFFEESARPEGGEAPGDGAPEGEAPAEDGPKRSFEKGELVQFDLEEALRIRDLPPGTDEEEGPRIDIKRVFRRRPLTDALALIHGSRADVGAAAPGAVRVDGTQALRRMLEAEIVALEQSTERLARSKETATQNTADEMKVVEELKTDLESWLKDSDEAAKLVGLFEGELGRVAGELEAAEAEIVKRGRELEDATASLTREIDRVAPAPQRRAAKP